MVARLSWRGFIRVIVASLLAGAFFFLTAFTDRQGKNDKSYRAFMGIGGGLLAFVSLTVCISLDVLGHRAARRRASRYLASRPYIDDADFATQFPQLDPKEPLVIRQKLADYFRVKPQQISAAESLAQLGFNVIGDDLIRTFGLERDETFGATSNDCVEQLVLAIIEEQRWAGAQDAN